MDMQLDHIVLNVENVDRALDFYVDVLGLHPERLDLYRSGEVLFPSVRINKYSLIDLLPPELHSPTHSPLDAARVMNVDHFCLTLTKKRWHAILTMLEARGIEIEAGPMTLWGARGDATAVYVHDGDGNRVELRYYDD